MAYFRNKKDFETGLLLSHSLSFNGQWFIVSYDSANKQKHHKSHRMQ